MKVEQDKIMKHRAFGSSHFHGKNHFQDNGMQNYLLFQSFYRYSKMFAKKSMKIMYENAPALNYIKTKLQVKFDGNCLKRDKVTFTRKQVTNIYIHIYIYTYIYIYIYVIYIYIYM